MTKKPILVLIGGGTCSGKSTLAERVGKYFHKFSVISTDNFMKFGISNYKPAKESLEEQIKKEYNCCDPQYLDVNELKLKIQQELNEQTPNKIIFVEGMHALYFEEIREIANLKLYSDTDADLRLIFKIMRTPWYKEMVGEEPNDPRKFGGSLPYAFDRWLHGVKPGEKKWIIPTKQYADLILTYNEEEDLSKNTELLNAFINLFFENPELYQQKLKELKEQGENSEKERVFDSLLELYRDKSKINSLYELIKQISQEKNRKIKVICDWDETIQPLKPTLFYKQLSSEGRKIEFWEFFKDFWENIPLIYYNAGTQIKRKTNEIFNSKYLTEEDIEKFEKSKKIKKMNKDDPFFNDPDLYKNAPFLSIAKELLQVLKEDLISELCFISSYSKDGNWVLSDTPGGDMRKKEKFLNSFSKFPICTLEITEIDKVNGEVKPYRWERLRESYSDFDIFIDDNCAIIESTRKNFSPDKIYVLPDYMCSRHVQANNIYHVGTSVSDLSNKEFEKVAKEWKLRKKEQEQAKRSSIAIEKKELEQKIEQLQIKIELP